MHPQNPAVRHELCSICRTIRLLGCVFVWILSVLAFNTRDIVSLSFQSWLGGNHLLLYWYQFSIWYSISVIWCELLFIGTRWMPDGQFWAMSISELLFLKKKKKSPRIGFKSCQMVKWQFKARHGVEGGEEGSQHLFLTPNDPEKM